MASKKFSIFIRPFRDAKSWVGYDSLKQTGSFIQGMFSDLLKHKEPNKHSETYEQAVDRYSLTTEALRKRRSQLFLFAMLYLTASIGLLAYSMQFFMRGMYLPFISTLCLVLMLLTFAFKEHFWYVQMRHKRLGLTFQQWLKATLTGEIK